MKLDSREKRERFFFRPAVNGAFFVAGLIFGIGIAHVAYWVMVVAVLMVMMFTAVSESYWHSAYEQRLAANALVSHLREQVTWAHAWSDRWRSIAMGHGDPWKGRGRPDA